MLHLLKTREPHPIKRKAAGKPDTTHRGLTQGRPRGDGIALQSARGLDRRKPIFPTTHKSRLTLPQVRHGEALGKRELHEPKARVEACVFSSWRVIWESRVRWPGKIGCRGVPLMAADEITAALVAIRQGRPEAIGELLTLVYDPLRAIARRRLTRRSDDDLDATALVHEAFLKLFQEPRPAWNDRRHFFSVAARAMRQIVVDDSRRRRSKKRGGSAQRVDLDSAVAIDDQTTRNLA